jgi:predicted N-acetyltransferase YhbS
LHVHAASLDDVPAIVEVLLRAHDEWPVGKLSTDEVFKAVTEFVTPPNGTVLLAIDENDEIVGVLALTFFTWWWSSEPTMLMEQIFYVVPEARQSTAAAKLLRGMKEIAELSGYPAMFGVSMPVDQERKEKLLSRYGKKYATMFITEDAK